MTQDKVVFLNPRTCGIYKDGGPRFKTDQITGLRTVEIDNELSDHVDSYLAGTMPIGGRKVTLPEINRRRILVPTYFDDRYMAAIKTLLASEKLNGVSLGELVESGRILIRGGHGSPSNDQRTGQIPYVKVSDIRGLRVNINPTNMVTESVAKRFWRGTESGLKDWDLITPNRASSNIGEFAVILPGEERVVLTKEVFVIRVIDESDFDSFYLLWALSLKAVREQWRRIALMQTNREDCGNRHLEIIIPNPKSKNWSDEVSGSFRTYFTTIANAKKRFIDQVQRDRFEHIANVAAILPAVDPESEDEAKEEAK